MHKKLILALAAVALTNLSIFSEAKAGVTVEFQEIGGDVVARTTGAFLVPTGTPSSAVVGEQYRESSPWSLFYYTGSVSWWSGGAEVETGLFGAVSASGDTFGFNSQLIYLPSGLTPGSSYAPETTWVWEDQTLASIGLSSLTTTPIVVYSRAGETISYVAAVPEPTSFALAGAGLLALCLRRRNRRA